MADFPHRRDFYASDRSIWEDGPCDASLGWRYFASEVGQWPLMGFGPFSVDETATGAYLGEVGIYQPVGYPEPELGWFVVPAAEACVADPDGVGSRLWRGEAKHWVPVQ